MTRAQSSSRRAPDPNEETAQQGGPAGGLAGTEPKSWSAGPLPSLYYFTVVWDETLKGAVVQIVIYIKRLYILVGGGETLRLDRLDFEF